VNDRLHGWYAVFLAGADAYIAVTIAGMLFNDQTAHRAAGSSANGDTTGVAFGIFLWAAAHAYMMVRSAMRDI